LIAFELEGVEIDHCLGCGGTWLDAGELDAIAERSGAPSGAFSAALREAGAGRRGERRCPRCRKRLRVVRVARGTVDGGAMEGGVVDLDHCPRGHGYWLDRGEVEAVIRIFHDGEGAAVGHFFSDLYHKELEPESKGG
jgi:Zn-finger nucleic acid-binding protein